MRMSPDSTRPIVAQYYLEALFRRKWLVLGPVVLATAAAALLCTVLPRIYRSSAIVLIEEKQISNPLIEGLAKSTSVRDRLTTLRTKILSRTQLERLALETKIASSADPERLAALIRRLSSRIEVDVVRANQVGISCEWEDPQMARTIVQKIVNFLIADNLALQQAEVDSATRFLEDQLERYRRRLSDAEVQLRDFDRIHLPELDALAAGQRGTPRKEVSEALHPGRPQLDRLQSYETERLDASIRLDELRHEFTAIVAMLGGTSPTIVSAAQRELNPRAKELKTRLATLEGRLAYLSIDSTAEHPEVVELKRLIKVTRDLLAQEADRLDTVETTTINPVHQDLLRRKQELETQSLAIEARLNGLDNLIDALRKDVATLPDKELDRTRLVREQNVNEAIYTSLLQRLETARITKRLEIDSDRTRFTVLDPPALPIDPVKPQRLQIFVLGLALGLCLGGSLAVAAEYIDTSLRTHVDARRFLDVPILGAIPLYAPHQPRLLTAQADGIRA
jgi:polysaccharide chain length determinant protein (PEP-CTERM system associated)